MNEFPIAKPEWFQSNATPFFECDGDKIPCSVDCYPPPAACGQCLNLWWQPGQRYNFRFCIKDFHHISEIWFYKDFTDFSDLYQRLRLRSDGERTYSRTLCKKWADEWAPHTHTDSTIVCSTSIAVIKQFQRHLLVSPMSQSLTVLERTVSRERNTLEGPDAWRTSITCRASASVSIL